MCCNSDWSASAAGCAQASALPNHELQRVFFGTAVSVHGRTVGRVWGMQCIVAPGQPCQLLIRNRTSAAACLGVCCLWGQRAREITRAYDSKANGLTRLLGAIHRPRLSRFTDSGMHCKRREGLFASVSCASVWGLF